MRAGVREILVLAVLAGVGLPAAEARPEPAADSWQLDIDYHDPQRITVRLPGEETERTYWYVLYTVTNKTDREVPFYPTFDIVTDKLEVIEGGDNINPIVYDAIKARHKKAYPFFVYPSEMLGPLLLGKDHARTSAIAFVPPDLDVNRFTLHIAGLSGEIEKVRNRAFDPSEEESPDNPRHFLLRRTLAVTYVIPGDVITRPKATPKRVEEEWVMR